MNKKTLKKISTTFLILMTVVLTSCGSDDDGIIPGFSFATLPAEFLGEYTGDLAYDDADDTITVADEATATVSGSGTYTISFSDGAPSLTGLRFVELTDGDYVLAGDDALPSTENVVEFGSSSLDIAFDEGDAEHVFAGDK